MYSSENKAIKRDIIRLERQRERAVHRIDTQHDHQYTYKLGGSVHMLHASVGKMIVISKVITLQDFTTTTTVYIILTHGWGGGGQVFGRLM